MTEKIQFPDNQKFPISKEMLNVLLDLANFEVQVNFKNGISKKVVVASLTADNVEIEGFERGEWTKFDPNDPNTFPPKGDEMFLTLANDGEIRSMCFDVNTALIWKHHISHWRPLPLPPKETEAGK